MGDSIRQLFSGGLLASGLSLAAAPITMHTIAGTTGPPATDLVLLVDASDSHRRLRTTAKVPEPTALAPLGLGLVFATAGLRRRLG